MLTIDPLLDSLGRALDVSALRQAVHAANIANADSEGYRRAEVEVTAAPPASSGADASVGEARVVAAADPVVRLDREMASMAQNAVRYQALVTAFERTLSMLRAAARDGKE